MEGKDVLNDIPSTDTAPDPGSRPVPVSPRFLTLRQVADELNTKDTTIRGLITSGELPAIQVGGRGQWRIERIKVEDYITAAYMKARAGTALDDGPTTELAEST